jgi:hypothetical protein
MSPIITAAGKPGTPGKEGAPGLHGAAGKDGPAGPPGKHGADGKDGEYPLSTPHRLRMGWGTQCPFFAVVVPTEWARRRAVALMTQWRLRRLVI